MKLISSSHSLQINSPVGVLENKTSIGVEITMLGVVPFVLSDILLLCLIFRMPSGKHAPVDFPKLMWQPGSVVIVVEIRLPESYFLVIPEDYLYKTSRNSTIKRTGIKI